jgi:hypothetical protein
MALLLIAYFIYIMYCIIIIAVFILSLLLQGIFQKDKPSINASFTPKLMSYT